MIKLIALISFRLTVLITEYNWLDMIQQPQLHTGLYATLGAQIGALTVTFTWLWAMTLAVSTRMLHMPLFKLNKSTKVV